MVILRKKTVSETMIILITSAIFFFLGAVGIFTSSPTLHGRSKDLIQARRQRVEMFEAIEHENECIRLFCLLMIAGFLSSVFNVLNDRSQYPEILKEGDYAITRGNGFIHFLCAFLLFNAALYIPIGIYTFKAQSIAEAFSSTTFQVAGEKDGNFLYPLGYVFAGSALICVGTCAELMSSFGEGNSKLR